MSKSKTDRTKLEFLRQRFQARQSRPGVHELVLVLDHLKPDFNVGKIFRMAEAFGAKEIHLAGIEWFDPGPAVGAFKKLPSQFHADFDACRARLVAEGYRLFALAPGGGEWLQEVKFPLKTALVLGNEGVGLSFDPAKAEGVTALRIPQWGQSQSLNVSVAAGVAAWEYLKQHGKFGQESKPQSGELRGESKGDGA